MDALIGGCRVPDLNEELPHSTSPASMRTANANRDAENVQLVMPPFSRRRHSDVEVPEQKSPRTIQVFVIPHRQQLISNVPVWTVFCLVGQTTHLDLEEPCPRGHPQTQLLEWSRVRFYISVIAFTAVGSAGCKSESMSPSCQTEGHTKPTEAHMSHSYHIINDNLNFTEINQWF